MHLKLNGTEQVPRQIKYVTTFLEAEVGGWKLPGIADDFRKFCFPRFARKYGINFANHEFSISKRYIFPLVT